MTHARRRCNLILTLLLLAGFTFTSWFSFHMAHNSLSEGIVDDALPLTSHLISTDLQKQLQAPIYVAQSMAQNHFVHLWLNDSDPSTDQLFVFLDKTRKLFQSQTSFLVNHKTLTYYHYDGRTHRLDLNAQESLWYQQAITSSHRDYILNVDVTPQDNFRAIVYVNHKIVLNGELLGVAGVGIQLSDLRALIKQYQTLYQRKVYFADHQGRLLFYNQSLLPNRTLHSEFGAHQSAIIEQKNYKFSVKHNGVERLINSRYIPELGWYLLVEQEFTTQTKLTDALIANLLLGVVITLCILAIAQLTFNQYQSRLEAIALTDKLCNVLNRQAFEPQLQKHIARARMGRVPLSLLLLDIDHFKQVNDRHGHLAGDRVLKHFAQLCQSVANHSDIICRWGGEEFMILMPNTYLSHAQQLSEKLRERLAACECEVPITISVGIAQYQPQESEDEFLKRADDALYRAKNRGRDRVELAA
ncbi:MULTISPECIES: sensor domain-containing diguanylate cyclase [Pseudoalteromonas]|uniref:diguanylate cyclase n=1 Tax=Pseudoalteromonas amylolytica TaxID=1859457 RepID=A0A1S1N1B8_9GAMM|nr:MULTISPECIES: sensor domain-containing diguanylate cyclase [Pseudoalteromonas]OHU91815.1 diguanylate cyclase [Pseudoalteromonas sp. JW3]OHU93141.1 diguanylate cyclase [Pseudoalteromonas amylolytica]